MKMRKGNAHATIRQETRKPPSESVGVAASPHDLFSVTVRLPKWQCDFIAGQTSPEWRKTDVIRSAVTAYALAKGATQPEDGK